VCHCSWVYACVLLLPSAIANEGDARSAGNGTRPSSFPEALASIKTDVYAVVHLSCDVPFLLCSSVYLGPSLSDRNCKKLSCTSRLSFECCSWTKLSCRACFIRRSASQTCMIGCDLAFAMKRKRSRSSYSQGTPGDPISRCSTALLTGVRAFPPNDMWLTYALSHCCVPVCQPTDDCVGPQADTYGCKAGACCPRASILGRQAVSACWEDANRSVPGGCTGGFLVM
jgi:hypothetical protein